MQNQPEQRKFDRIATERPISIQRNQTSIQGKMLDLSENGIGILSPEPVTTGEKVSVDFNLPLLNRASIQLEGIIIHVTSVRQQYLIGLQFTNLPTHMQAMIAEFIRYHHRLD
ncbi:MAG: PilZ domain-containing protein [Hydrogenovibrio crunogenus]|uniref:PilZ domain-containing protein n=1 Tax=Hydrogenovibrio crunogenus (strain DSM 25203 / XCL-2) TaxID=317025 RepID=Q31IP5_HYDCU|nr:PilZ domain-containing protein [Hydrogenovibrio crunogenus]